MRAANPTALGQVSVHHAAWTTSSSAWVTGQDIYLHLSHRSGPLAYKHTPSFFMLLYECTSLWAEMAEMAVRNRQIFVTYNSNIMQGVGTGIGPSGLQQHPSVRKLRVQFCIKARTAWCQGAFPYFAFEIIFLNCIFLFLLYCIVGSGWDCLSKEKLFLWICLLIVCRVNFLLDQPEKQACCWWIRYQASGYACSWD